LSQQLLMFVYPDGAWPQGAPGEPQPSYYWRSLTYDQYTGHGWRTSRTNAIQYEAGEMTQSSPGTPSRPTVRQKVQAVESLGGRLYVTGELLTADHDYRVNWRSSTDAFGAEIQADAYQADSRVSLVSEEELRSAGSAFPDWVQEHYLTLPGEIPPRVLALARSLTANEPTPYDQARAIERHLRTYPYTLDLPAPPPEQDVADYFLFDLQRGYCDYYATAMVVLARAAGLPSRLVIGYASGAYDAINERYVVTEANAHSWVEVYFAGHGWIEFEPTASRARLERPTWVETSAPRAALQPAGQGRAAGMRPVLLGALGLAATLALGGLAWWAVDGWRLQRLSPALAVSTLYQRLYHHGQRLAVPTQAGSTAHEFETALARRVITLTQNRRGAAPPASIAQNTRWLTDLYTRELYSPHSPNSTEQTQALKTWRQLQSQLWLAWLWKKRGARGERQN
jgi:transglutaminase-like putative cysteine protease